MKKTKKKVVPILGVTVGALDKILTLPKPADAIALYGYYAWQSCLAGDLCFPCANQKAAKKMQWGVTRLARVKGQLVKIGIVRVPKRARKKNGQLEPAMIELRFTKANQFIEMELSYRAYLFTPEWKAIRKQVIARDGGKCQACARTQRLNVHHLTYAHIFEEAGHLEDLVTLCRTCHEDAHGITVDKRGNK